MRTPMEMFLCLGLVINSWFIDLTNLRSQNVVYGECNEKPCCKSIVSFESNIVRYIIFNYYNTFPFYKVFLTKHHFIFTLIK